MYDYVDLIIDKLNDKSNKIVKDLYDNMSTYQKNIFNKLITDKNYSLEYSLNDLVFDFDSILIPKRTRILDDLHNNIILLYAKNNSVNDIKDLLKSMFNIDLSTAYISSVTQEIANHVLEWRNKELDPCYFCINIDCLYITIRDNKALVSHKIPVYVAIRTKLNGHKEIVGLYLGNEDEYKNTIDSLYNKNIWESETFWTEIFEDLKDRGVKKLLFLVSDGVWGIAEVSKEAFPGVFHQICVVHLVRNLKKYATKTYSKEVIGDFKKVYTSSKKRTSWFIYRRI